MNAAGRRLALSAVPVVGPDTVATDETQVLTRDEIDEMINPGERARMLQILNERAPSPLWREFSIADLRTLTKGAK